MPASPLGFLPRALAQPSRLRLAELAMTLVPPCRLGGCLLAWGSPMCWRCCHDLHRPAPGRSRCRRRVHHPRDGGGDGHHDGRDDGATGHHRHRSRHPPDSVGLSAPPPPFRAVRLPSVHRPWTRRAHGRHAHRVARARPWAPAACARASAWRCRRSTPSSAGVRRARFVSPTVAPAATSSRWCAGDCFAPAAASWPFVLVAMRSHVVADARTRHSRHWLVRGFRVHHDGYGCCCPCARPSGVGAAG